MALAATQALYTLLYIAEVNVPRQLLWGLEGILFTILIAFAGAAMVQAKHYHVAGAVVALSFMIYYVAKLLLGFAALIFGIAKMTSGAKALGSITVLVGVVAMLANAILIVFGRDAFLPSPVAGGFGVLATLLLALCLMSIAREDEGKQ